MARSFSQLMTLAYGVVCYTLFNLLFVYLVFFLLDMAMPKTINNGPLESVGSSLAINLVLIAAFGITHSVMARDRFKRWLKQFVPIAAERSTYVLQSTLFLALLIWQWRPMTFEIWSFEGIGAWPFYGLFVIGLVITLWSTFLIDHFELFGLKQVWRAFRAEPMSEPIFKSPALYKFVRHPMQLGMIIMFIATPQLTVGHLLFAASMTLYAIIGTKFEERALLREFGDQYRAYRRDVPMLLPRIWASPTIASPTSVTRP